MTRYIVSIVGSIVGMVITSTALIYIATGRHEKAAVATTEIPTEAYLVRETCEFLFEPLSYFNAHRDRNEMVLYAWRRDKRFGMATSGDCIVDAWLVNVANATVIRITVPPPSTAQKDTP